jgi:hypothetical protein
MTLNDLQRAALVLFAAREVGPEGSPVQMRAVCHVIRNRVRAGWGDANWFTVIEQHPRVAGNGCGVPGELDINDRRLAMLARDIDEIFYGEAMDEIGQLCAPPDKSSPVLLYWAFIDRPVAHWFLQNIIRQPEHHKQRAQVGNNLYLYE